MPPPSQQELAQLRKNVALGKRVTEHDAEGKARRAEKAAKKRKAAGEADPQTEAEALAAKLESHQARAAAKANAARMTSDTKLWRHLSLQLRPRSLPELLVAAGRLDVDIFKHPSMLWMVDTVLSSEHLPVAWEKSGKTEWAAMQSSTAKSLNKLTSTERLRFVAYGEVPNYTHALLRVNTEQNPMVGVIKDAERSLVNPLNLQIPEDMQQRVFGAHGAAFQANAFR